MMNIAWKLRQTLYNMNTFTGAGDYSIPKLGRWGKSGHLVWTKHEEITSAYWTEEDYSKLFSKGRKNG